MEKKKSSRISEEDRLSNLPDDLIRHILSFLETKFAVRTSILSKNWLFHWKRLRVLNFDTQSFPLLPPFRKFVYSVLRCRANNSVVTKLRYASRSLNGSMVDRMLKYAFDHDVEHLIMDISEKRHRLALRIVAYQALERLELGGFFFPESFPCSTITTMRLENCSFWYYGNDLDVFAGCQSLKILTLIDCTLKLSLSRGCTFTEALFKITASQLMNLKIISKWFSFPMCKCKFQIFAPQLEYFSHNCNPDEVQSQSGTISQFVEFVSCNSQCRISDVRTFNN